MGILHLDLGLAVDGVDLPRLDQALLLLCVCMGDELELGLGEGGWVDAVLGEEGVEGLEGG